MENMMTKLNNLREKDIYYYAKARIDRLCARSNIYKLLSMPNVVSVIIVDTTETEYGGGDEIIKSTREKKRRIKKGQEVKVYPFNTFDKNGTEHILAPIGGDRGIIRTGLYRAITASGKAKYWAPPIDHVRVFPEGDMDLGEAPPERPVRHPIFVLEPRSKGKTAEVVGYEAVINREVEFWVKVNVACPLAEDDIITLLHGIEDVPLGPTKRGHITILDLTKGKVQDYSSWLDQHQGLIRESTDMEHQVPLELAESEKEESGQPTAPQSY